MIINNKNHIDSKAVSIIAQSNFREMINYGFTKNQIINFSTEILDILIKTGKENTNSNNAYYKTSVTYESKKNTVQKICGPNLYLRPFVREDIFLFNIWRKKKRENKTFIDMLSELSNKEIIYKFSKKENKLFITHLNNDQPIGFMIFKTDHIESSKTEMKKFIGESNLWGKGYGKEMSYCWLNYGFTKLNFRKIIIKTFDTNISNIAVNKKLGFQLEGHLQKETCINGKYIDILIMSLLKNDFRL